MKEMCKLSYFLGTRYDHFDGGWVGFEWKSFINEIHSGRKHGRVFSFASGLSVDDLTYALRFYQMIPYDPASHQESFENLVSYIGHPKRCFLGHQTNKRQGKPDFSD